MYVQGRMPPSDIDRIHSDHRPVVTPPLESTHAPIVQRPITEAHDITLARPGRFYHIRPARRRRHFRHIICVSRRVAITRKEGEQPPPLVHAAAATTWTTSCCPRPTSIGRGRPVRFGECGLRTCGCNRRSAPDAVSQRGARTG